MKELPDYICSLEKCVSCRNFRARNGFPTVEKRKVKVKDSETGEILRDEIELTVYRHHNFLEANK